MERFAIKIDKKLKANLYKICRLCGIDNPDMVPIIGDKQANNENAIDVDAEMEMKQKINLLIGLSITKDDRMPQTMCCLCVDKINDFYEFREMCYATNAQTRKLLGLKNIKKVSMDIKPKVEVKQESIIPTSTLTSASNKNGNRKRKCEEGALKEETPENSAVGSKKKLRFSALADQVVKEETPGVTKKKLRFNTSNDEPATTLASSSKKSKNNIIEDTKLKKEPSPPALAPIPAVSNKKLRLAGPIQKESATKKSKQKGGKNVEQKENEIKEEIKLEIKEELSPVLPVPKQPPVPPVPKLKFGCNICKERFPVKVNLEAHNRTAHIPKIERYVCAACNEVLSKSFDIKNHQLWHKLSKTPYVCGCCGESIMNTYAFSRHLREHAFETPAALLVLDRECPQCHTSYATNFLYNIHSCAVKTKRCAGCNRLQRNDAEYLKHSAQCAKVYLNYSKHIMPSVEALEDAVRIKNENEVEAAAEEMARISGVPLDMAPVVQLTRLSSPIIMAASQCASAVGLDDVASSNSKKSGKKGVSKKDFKRVDELLKSTLDALVSIKHEPEVHVDQETPCATEHSDNDEHRGLDDAIDQDDFRHKNDSDNESDKATASTTVLNTNEISATMESVQEQIKIKQEIDETSQDNSNKIGGGLKLKIKKEHGQLNSSIIEQQKCSDKRAEKRKKKKKHKDKEKDKQRVSKDMQDEQVSQDSNVNNYNSDMNVRTPTIRIKAEPQDGSEATEKQMGSLLQTRPQPEATIMTSIPMMQFQIACVSSGVEFNNGTNAVADTHQTMSSANHEAEPEDVKPNREELDRMLKIAHVTSGIAMETEENEAQPMDYDGNYGRGNAGDDDGEGECHDEYNDDYNRDDNEYENQEHTRPEHPDNEQEAEEKIEKDLEKLSDDTGIDNKAIIAKKIKKLTLQPKPKLNFKTKDKLLETATKSRNKACKSTAKPPNMPIIQISTVQSGVVLEPSAPSASDFIPVFIKPEPQNRGYSDEQAVEIALPQPPQPPQSQTEIQEKPEECSSSHSAEERNYISSIDFNNVTIKQERDIEINDVQITQKSIKSFTELNGIKRKRKQAVRSHYTKNKIPQQDDNMKINDENTEEGEEHESGEEDEDESVDGELDEEEEVGEDEDEEEFEEEDEDEGEEEEEYEEREYRELEYPPELVETKLKLETEVHNDTEPNEYGNEIKAEDQDSRVKDNSYDTSKISDSNITFVISNVCSQANTRIADVDSSKSNDDHVGHEENVLNQDNNVLTSTNISGVDNFKITPYCEDDSNKNQTLGHALGDNTAEHLSYTRNKDDTLIYVANSSYDNDLSIKTPNAIGEQADLQAIVTSNENHAKNNHYVSPTLSEQILQETIQPCEIPLKLGQPFQVNREEPVRQILEDLNCSQETPILDFVLQSSERTENSGEQLQNRGNNSQYAAQNPQENSGQVFEEENTTLKDTVSNRLDGQESLQNILQYSTDGAQIDHDHDHSLESNDQQQQQISDNTLKHSQEMQSSSHDLLKDLPNIHNFEVKPQTSEYLQSVCEISSTRTQVLNVSSEISNNPSNDYDGHQISKDNQEQTATIEGVVQQPDDLNLEARPATQNFDNESIDDEDDDGNRNGNELEEGDNNNDDSTVTVGNDIEERQNYQNQEVLSQIKPTAITLHPYLEDISSSSNSLLSNSLSQTPPPPLQPVASTACVDEFNMQRQGQQMLLNREETENILNESNVVLSRRSFEVAQTSATSLAQQLPPNMPTFNFDNINEIAENNNNANIEREQLQDGQQYQYQHN